MSGFDDDRTANVPRGVREAAVLTGGRSRRMGEEKALLEIDDLSFLERSLRLLGTRYERLLVSVPHEGPAAEIAAIAARLGADRRIDVVADRRPGQPGPLGALESILTSLEGPAAFVIAVDLPVFYARLLDALEQAVRAPGTLAVIPTWNDRVEPLYSVYAREALPLISRLLDRGERRPRALAGEPGVILLEVLSEGQEPSRAPSFVSAFDPEEIFRNVNTPEEYREYRSRGSGGPGSPLP